MPTQPLSSDSDVRAELLSEGPSLAAERHTTPKRLQLGSFAVAVLALIASTASSWTTVMAFRRARVQDEQDALRRKADELRLKQDQDRLEQERRLAKRQDLRVVLQRLSAIPRELAVDEFTFRSGAVNPQAGVQANFAASSAHNTENTFLAKQAYDIIRTIEEDVSASECLAAASGMWGSYLFDLQAKMLDIAITKAEKAVDPVDLVNALRGRASLSMQMGDASTSRQRYGEALAVFARPGFASSNRFFVDFTQYNTYTFWASSELGQRNCNEAKIAWTKANDLWSSMLAPMLGKSVAPLHMTMKMYVDLCR